MALKYFMLLTLLCSAMAARVKQRQHFSDSKDLLVDKRLDGTAEKNQMSSMSDQSGDSKQSDQSHKSDQAQQSTQSNEQSNAKEKQASLANLASPDSGEIAETEKDEGQGKGLPAESDESGEPRMTPEAEDIGHRGDSGEEPQATGLDFPVPDWFTKTFIDQPGEIEEPLDSEKSGETLEKDCDKPDNSCGGIVKSLKKLWDEAKKKFVQIFSEYVTEIEDGVDFEHMPLNHSSKCRPRRASLAQMTAEKEEVDLPEASQSFLEAHEVSSVLGLNGSGKAGLNASSKVGTPHHEIVSALLGVQSDTSDKFTCSTDQWNEFAKRFSVTRRSNQCPHPNDDRNNYEDRSPCSEKSVLFLYPDYDHNAAFCVNKQMCTRMNTWYSHACSVHLYRVSSISEASWILDKFSANSLKHVVLGGHGDGKSFEWGRGQSCGNSDFCVHNTKSRRFLEKLSGKMHQHASLFLDSCHGATENSAKKSGGVNLAEYVASVVGKGIRVIGAAQSFGSGLKINRYIAWHAAIDTANQNNVERTHVASGGRCPSWARTSTPDNDGDCTCPSGKKCKTTEGKDCPRSQGKVSDTYFLPMCANSWSKVSCQCVTSSSQSAETTRTGWLKRHFAKSTPNLITQQTFGGNRAFVVVHNMAYGWGAFWNDQSEWRTSWSSLQTWIKGKWDEGYELTSIRYGLDDQWAGVVTKGTCVSGSGWATRDTFDKARAAIKDAWDKDASLLDISYGSDKYMLTTGKCSEMGGQSWKAGTWNEVKAFISEKWGLSPKYYITSFTRLGDGRFFIMMTRNPHFSSQTYGWHKASDVQTWIKKKWDEKYQITTIFDDYEKDSDTRYFVVMTKVSGSNFFPNQGAYGTYVTQLTL